ncbi:MAG: conjugal transfer protein [Candidatus Pristimantibacillus sp.]
MAFGFRGKKDPKEKEELPRSKKQADSAIKPRSPKTITLKRVLRVSFWIVAALIVLKGCTTTLKGEQTINQTIIQGNTNDGFIDDSIKGFAIDFTTEYLNWDIEKLAERSERLSKFISGIDNDGGLDTNKLTGSSRVLSTEIYNSKKINDSLVEVTVMVRREYIPVPTPTTTSPEASTTALSVANIISKLYLVVPVTISSDGLVIQSYPKFIGDQPKGTKPKDKPDLEYISEDTELKKGKDLAEGFLQAWYAGSVDQLKYFYEDSAATPTNISDSGFILDQIQEVKMYRDKNNTSTLYLEATVTVKSSVDESFTNLWRLIVTEKESRLYVKSIEQASDELPASSPDVSTEGDGMKADEDVPAPSINTTPADSDANVTPLN